MSKSKSKKTPSTGKAKSNLPPHPSELKDPADAIKGSTSKVKQGRFANAEKDFIRENVSKLSVREMANKLGRKKLSVADWCKSNGISTNRPDLWTDKDIEFLIANAGSLSSNEIAKKLGRTNKAVLLKASIMKVSVALRDPVNRRYKNPVRKGYGGKSMRFTMKNKGLPKPDNT